MVCVIAKSGSWTVLRAVLIALTVAGLVKCRKSARRPFRTRASRRTLRAGFPYPRIAICPVISSISFLPLESIVSFRAGAPGGAIAPVGALAPGRARDSLRTWRSVTSAGSLAPGRARDSLRTWRSVTSAGSLAPGRARDSLRTWRSVTSAGSLAPGAPLDSWISFRAIAPGGALAPGDTPDSWISFRAWQPYLAVDYILD